MRPQLDLALVTAIKSLRTDQDRWQSQELLALVLAKKSFNLQFQRSFVRIRIFLLHKAFCSYTEKTSKMHKSDDVKVISKP